MSKTAHDTIKVMLATILGERAEKYGAFEDVLINIPVSIDREKQSRHYPGHFEVEISGDPVIKKGNISRDSFLDLDGMVKDWFRNQDTTTIRMFLDS